MSSSCRIPSFWCCCIVLCVVECIPTLLSAHLFLQSVSMEPVLHEVPLPSIGVIGGCVFLECSLRSRLDWTSGNRSSRCGLALGSDSHFSWFRWGHGFSGQSSRCSWCPVSGDNYTRYRHGWGWGSGDWIVFGGLCCHHAMWVVMLCPGVAWSFNGAGSDAVSWWSLVP